MKRRYRNDATFGRFRDIAKRAKFRCKRVRESDDLLGINHLVARERHKAWLEKTAPQREKNHAFVLADRSLRRLVGKPRFAPAAPYRTGRQKRIARKAARKAANG